MWINMMAYQLSQFDHWLACMPFVWSVIVWLHFGFWVAFHISIHSDNFTWIPIISIPESGIESINIIYNRHGTSYQSSKSCSLCIYLDNPWKMNCWWLKCKICFPGKFDDYDLADDKLSISILKLVSCVSEELILVMFASKIAVLMFVTPRVQKSSPA